MYNTLLHMEQLVLLLLLLLSLTASFHSSRLIYSRSEKELNDKTQKLKLWTLVLMSLSTTAVAVNIAITAVQPLLWMDRLLLRAPLIALPACLLWLYAMPRLHLLQQRTKARKEQRLDLARRRHATDTALIGPFKLTALIAAGSVYFVFTAPYAVHWLHTALPLFVMLLLGVFIWTRQSNLPNRPMTVYYNNGARLSPANNQAPREQPTEAEKPGVMLQLLEQS